MKKIIVFDFDGVLINSFDMNLSLTKEYDPQITADEYKMMFTGNVYDSLETRSKQVKYKPSFDFDFFREYSERMLKIKPTFGLESVLKTIKDSGLSVYIISSTDSHPIKNYLEFNHLDQYFSRIYGADIDKSKVKKFQMILDSTQSKPSEILFITDTLGDLIEAHSLNIDCIAVSFGFHDRSLFEKAPMEVPVIDHIEELIKYLN